MADGPDEVLRMVGDGWAGLGAGNAHPAEGVSLVLFLRLAGFLSRRVLFVGREGREVTVEAGSIWVARLPTSLVFEHIELQLSDFFLHFQFIYLFWRNITSINFLGLFEGILGMQVQLESSLPFQ